MTFKEKFPNGLRRTIVLFEKAFYEIMNSDEIDKVINSAHGSEKRNLIKLKKSFDPSWKWYDYHWIPVSMSINSPMLYADIICKMVELDDETVLNDIDE